MEGKELIDKLRDDELQSIRNDVSTGLRDHILKTLDERGRAQELVRQQYSGRYPFELLQNANDASADSGGGAVAFIVTDHALVVADRGSGFGPDQIRAICGLGRSSKDPRKTIGYKGLGFKSVGEISARPQVIDSDLIFGFDDSRTRRAVEGLAGPIEATQRLPVYAFPFSLDRQDLEPDGATIIRLQERGFTTVLRLAFQPGVTRELVARQVRDTITPRLLLFLDATESLQVSGVVDEFSADVVRSTSDGCIETLLQVGEETEHWLVFRKAIGDLDRTLVDPLGDAWRLVEEVHVALAVRLDEEGRPAHSDPQPLHVYFPTEEATGLSIILQGDFALDLDRRHAARSPETLPYNRWLGAQVGILSGEVAEFLAHRYPNDVAVVSAFAPAGTPSGFGEYLTGEVLAALKRVAFVPVVGGGMRSPDEALLLPASLPRIEIAHRFLDLSEHAATVLPAVEIHPPSRRLLADLLGTPQLTTEDTLQLISEPDPGDDATFYQLLVDWADNVSTHRFATQLAKVACVRNLGGGWVSSASGVFFPRQREEVQFPAGLQVPIVAVPEVEGLRPLLESAGVRPFEWRLLIPDFVIPLLETPDLDESTRQAALAALHGYYETERTGDPRMRALIAQALLPARDAAGNTAAMLRAGSLYFTASWLGHGRLERIYGPFDEVEFLAVEPPSEEQERLAERSFYEWMGVGAHPRIDERRADQRDVYLVTSLGRHPHRSHSALWSSWQAEPEVRAQFECGQGHAASLQQLRASYALDRFPELAAAQDPDRLALLWQELCADWARYQPAMTAELKCNHGWHTGDSIRYAPSLLDHMLRQIPWVPCVRNRRRTVVVPSRAWRITSETPPRIAERVDVLDRTLDVAKSAPLVAALSVVDAARPAPENLVALLRELSRDFTETPQPADSRDVQLAARWAMRTLNDSIERGGSIDVTVPLLARLDGRHVFSETPFIANDPLLAETWEPVFPILDADRDLRRLHSALGLRDLDEEVEIVPVPLRPRPDLRVEFDRRVSEAKPYIAAVAIDQVASRHSDVIRGLARLEVSVCEDLVLRYTLDGEDRERPEAVSYIAVRVEQDGPIIRRRVGTAHLELDPRTQAPHWYGFGPQLAQFLGVPGLGDAFALLLAASREERQRYLAARRISVSAIDEARLDLAQPDDEGLEELLRVDSAREEDEEDMEERALVELPLPTGAGTSVVHNLETDEPTGEPAGARQADPELPAVDFDSLTIKDAPNTPSRDGPVEPRRPTHQPPGFGPLGPIDHNAVERLQRRIGKRGERVVYEVERRRLIAMGRDPDVVVWRSREHEFAPYDIESQDEDGQLIYIEVKSTTSGDPCDPFEISDAELHFAIRKRSNYYIYRVTEAQTVKPLITRYQDPIGRLRDNTAQLRLSGARLTFAVEQRDAVE